MKTLLAALIAVSTTASFAQNKPLTTTYSVNPETTKVEWTGKKVAGPHMGTIKAKSGSITVQGEEITSGKIVMDMNTITVTDLEGEWKEKLEGHLKHSDFFDVAQYPEATLVIKSSKKTPKGLEINGDLTIKDKTHPVSFLASDVKKTADAFEAKSEIKVDRTKYGVTYNSGKGQNKDYIKSLGDKLIYDEFTLNVTFSAKK